MSINDDLITKINPLLIDNKYFIEKFYDEGIIKTNTITGINTAKTEDAINYRPMQLNIEGNSKQGALPDGYTQLDYIQSSGTQYIDMGVNADNNKTIEVNFTPTSIEDNALAVLGASKDALSSIYSVQISTFNIYIQFGDNVASGLAPTVNTNYTVKMGSGGRYINGTLYNSDINTFDDNLNMYLFARNKNGSVERYTSLKMYYCKVWDGDKLIRNMIPCFRNSDNKAGMYDLVNGVFYTNAGTGAFSYEYANTARVKKQGIIKMPSGYTRVDYIQNTGTSYIVTEFYGDLYVEGIAQYIDASSSDIQILFGQSSGAARWFGARSGSVYSDTYTFSADITKQFSFAMKWTFSGTSCANIIALNNVAKTRSIASSTQTLRNLTLFNAQTSTGVFSYPALAKISEFIIYSNDTKSNIIGNLIPCIRNSDNEVGMYDLINKVFYTNQGSGSFTYGSVIDELNPDNAMNIANITGDIKLKGKNVYDGTRTTSEYGLTYTLDEEILVINGTPTASTKYNAKNMTFAPGVYTIIMEHISGDLDTSAQTTQGADNIPFYMYVGTTWTTKTTIGYFTTATTKIASTFTLTESAYLNLGFYAQTKNVYNNYTIKYQIVKGQINDYDFELYKEVTIPLGNKELCSISNYPVTSTINDVLSINSKTGEVTKTSNIKKIVFDGTESWVRQSTNSYGIANYQLNVSDTYSTAQAYQYIMCDKFKQQSTLIANTTTEGILLNEQHAFFVRIDSSRANTASAFKTWLSNNPVTVYYRLATPTTEIITTLSASDLEKLNIPVGTSRINLVANLNGTITVEYISDAA